MKILLVQLRRIGDVITTTPATRAIRGVWKDAQIDFLTEPPSDEIYRHNPYIDNLIVIPRNPPLPEFISYIRKIRAERYDVVIDFLCNPTSAYITWLSGAKDRVGFGVRFRKIFYNHTVSTDCFPPHLYSGVHKVALAANVGAAPVGGYYPEFYISDADQALADELLASVGVVSGDRLVTFSVATRHKFRQWQVERFAELADLLMAEFNVKILLTYAPDEKEMSESVARLMKKPPLSLIDTGSLSVLRGVFSRVVLHIGCDNGGGNIAKTSGKPNISLFSNSYASSWTPPDDPHFVGIDHRRDCPLDKCLHEACPDPICVGNITVAEVFAAAEKFLKKGG